MLMIIRILFIFLWVPVTSIYADYSARFSERLCHSGANMNCIMIHKGDTWDKLFPDPDQRDAVQRLNRTNMRLVPGTRIAVSDDIKISNRGRSFVPFNDNIGPQNKKTIIVDLKHLSWGAYDKSGQLLRWGPASGGRRYCSDLGRACRSPVGTFEIYRREGAGCISNKFPIGEGGAPMPYCMFFHGGFALHGSNDVPGFNASHGCVRLFKSDARWLNQDFIDMPGQGGTTVVVRPY